MDVKNGLFHRRGQHKEQKKNSVSVFSNSLKWKSINNWIDRQNRTSTNENDRGKGLQDLLEFIRKRENGYLSILSLKGLYKFSVLNGRETIKSERFSNAIGGTLIIWSATLDN